MQRYNFSPSFNSGPRELKQSDLEMSKASSVLKCESKEHFLLHFFAANKLNFMSLVTDDGAK